MTTIKLSFSPARAFSCYRETLRRNRGLGAFFGALVFIFLPLQYWLSLLNAKSIQDSVGPLAYFLNNMAGLASCYNGVAAIFFTGLALFGAVILPTALFGYLHNRRAVDVYHSLPYTREELLVAHCGTGLTLLYLPIILSFLMMAGMSFLLPGLSAAAILVDMLCWLVIIFAIFMITVFAAVQVGSLFDTAVFSIVLNGSLSAVWLMGVGLSSSFLYGFNASDDMIMTAYKLSPVSLIIGRVAASPSAGVEFATETNVAILLWLLGGLLLFAGAMIMYRRRKSEQAEVLGTLGPLSLYVRAVGTLLAGVCLGMIFISVFNLEDEEFWVLSIIFLSSVLSYFIGDVILARSVRGVRKALPAAVAMAVLVTGFVGCIMLDLTGFELRVPKATEVQSVVVSGYAGRYSDQSDFRETATPYLLELNSPEAVALILEAHRQQVESHKQSGEESTQISSRSYELILSYKTNTGEVNRRYYSPYDSTRASLLQLETNSEFVQKGHPIFRATPDDIRKVEAYSALSDVNQELTPNAAQRKELLAAVQADLAAQTAEELRGTKMLARLLIELPYEPYAREVETQNGDSTKQNLLDEEWTERSTYVKVLVTPSCTQTIAFLNANGMGFILEDQKARIDTAYIRIPEHSRTQSVVTQYSAQERSVLEELLNSTSPVKVGLFKLTPEQLEAYYPHMVNVISTVEPTVAVVVTSRPGSGRGTLEQSQDAMPAEDSFYFEEDTFAFPSDEEAALHTEQLGRPAVAATGVYYLPLSVLDPALAEKLIISTYVAGDRWLLSENNIDVQISDSVYEKYGYEMRSALVDQFTVVRKDGKFILTTKENAPNLQ